MTYWEVPLEFKSNEEEGDIYSELVPGGAPSFGSNYRLELWRKISAMSLSDFNKDKMIKAPDDMYTLRICRVPFFKSCIQRKNGLANREKEGLSEFHKCISRSAGISLNIDGRENSIKYDEACLYISVRWKFSRNNYNSLVEWIMERRKEFEHKSSTINFPKWKRIPRLMVASALLSLSMWSASNELNNTDDSERKKIIYVQMVLSVAIFMFSLPYLLYMGITPIPGLCDICRLPLDMIISIPNRSRKIYDTLRCAFIFIVFDTKKLCIFIWDSCLSYIFSIRNKCCKYWGQCCNMGCLNSMLASVSLPDSYNDPESFVPDAYKGPISSIP